MTFFARLVLGGGAVVMALAVALGAYAAHAAKNAAHPEASRLLQTAVLYMLVHGLGLAIVGVLGRANASPWLVAAAVLMAIGIACFCGSLWYLALSGRSLGPVAPIGGLAFIAGWLALAFYAFTSGL